MGLDFLIIGATGQDGSLLSSLIRKKNLSVLGLGRPSFGVTMNNDNHHIEVDCCDFERFKSVVAKHRPTKIIQLAGINPSSVTKNFESQLDRSMYQAHVQVTMNAIRVCMEFETSLTVALSSKMFTPPVSHDQLINENSKAGPDTYYGQTKFAAWNLIKQYREKYGLPFAGAILFNHVGYRESRNFLSTLLVDQTIEIVRGVRSKFELSNWDERVDISHPDDIVEGLYAISEAKASSDFVLGSGVAISPGELAKASLQLVEATKHLDKSQLGIPGLGSFRSALLADNSKARREVGWDPKRSIVELIASEVNKKLSASL
jgi:GDPmannose 4,6-dehydratase